MYLINWHWGWTALFYSNSRTHKQELQRSRVAREATLKAEMEDKKKSDEGWIPFIFLNRSSNFLSVNHLISFSFLRLCSLLFFLPIWNTMLFSFVLSPTLPLSLPPSLIPPLSLYYCVQFRRLSGCFLSPRHNVIHSYYIKRRWHQLFEGYIRLHRPMIRRMRGDEWRQMDGRLGESCKERQMRGT